MKNKLFQILRLLPQIAICIFVLCSLIVNVLGFNYINELERQVAQRDSIINHLTFSNKLVEEFFDVTEDSINNQRIYTLKDEKRTKKIKIKTTKYIEPSFIRGNDTLNIDELVLMFNKVDSMHNKQLDTIYSKYNFLVDKCNRILYEKQSLRDTVTSQRMALDLIKKNYDIGYSWYVKGNVIHVTLESHKADSAFLLFPYFKNKLKFNDKKNIWTIKK